MGIQNLPHLTENICSYSNSCILDSLLQMAWGEKVTQFLLLSIGLENNYILGDNQWAWHKFINENDRANSLLYGRTSVRQYISICQISELGHFDLQTSLLSYLLRHTKHMVATQQSWTKSRDAVLFNYMSSFGCGKNFNHEEELNKLPKGLILNFNNATDKFPTVLLLGLYFCS